MRTVYTFLFEEILGIKQAENSVRYDKVIISPVFAECLSYAKGKITTPHGEISVSWQREDGKTNVVITLCEGINAVFCHKEQKNNLKAGLNEFTI